MYSQYWAELSSVHQAGTVYWNRCLVWEHRPDKISVTVGLASSCWERIHCCTGSQPRTEVHKYVSNYFIVASCFVVFISVLMHYALGIYHYMFRPLNVIIKHCTRIFTVSLTALSLKWKTIIRNISSVGTDQCRETAVYNSWWWPNGRKMYEYILNI
jgi:hypothetical protein